MNMPEINGLFWVQKVANLIKWVWQKRGSSLGDEKYRIGVVIVERELVNTHFVQTHVLLQMEIVRIEK